MGLAQYKCFWDRADPGIGEQDVDVCGLKREEGGTVRAGKPGIRREALVLTSATEAGCLRVLMAYLIGWSLQSSLKGGLMLKFREVK